MPRNSQSPPRAVETTSSLAVGCAVGYLDFRFPQLGWRNDRANVARLADKLNARKTFIETAPPTP